MEFSDIKSIVLIDDDETTNFLNKVFIQQHFPDMEVHMQTNGKDALAFIGLNYEQIAPAIILLDTMMPIMDGWDFAKAFHERFDEDFKNQFRIVMLSANYSDTMVEQARKYPAIKHVIQKPLSDLKFRIFIEKYF